jgi:hypothetical protein
VSVTLEQTRQIADLFLDAGAAEELLVVLERLSLEESELPPRYLAASFLMSGSNAATPVAALGAVEAIREDALFQAFQHLGLALAQLQESKQMPAAIGVFVTSALQKIAEVLLTYSSTNFGGFQR